MTAEEVYRHPEDYDLEVASRHERDLPFWLDVLRRERARTLLEIGCGTGRLTVPLAREGLAWGGTVTGLDPEPAMLRRAEVRAREAFGDGREGAPRFVVGDARTMDLGERFDAVLAPYGVAHHLTELDDQLAAWRAVWRHLVPGGLYVVEVNAPQLQRLAAPDDRRTEDMNVCDHRGHCLNRTAALRYAAAVQRATLAYDYDVTDPDGARRRYRSDFIMHVYFPREFALLFRATGFQLERLVGSYDGEPFGDDSRQMIAFARRPMEG